MTMKENLDICDCNIIHAEIVEKVRNKMPEDENLYDLADLFKVFCDSTRVKILSALFTSEICVCDLANLLNMKQSAISHQLRVLRHSKLVKFRREGKVLYYSLCDDHVKNIFAEGLKHINE